MIYFSSQPGCFGYIDPAGQIEKCKWHCRGGDGVTFSDRLLDVTVTLRSAVTMVCSVILAAGAMSSSCHMPSTS